MTSYIQDTLLSHILIHFILTTTLWDNDKSPQILNIVPWMCI